MIGLLLGLLLMVQPPDSVNKNRQVLHDSLMTAEGYINLEELNWKYKAGDDTSWAAPGYDDSNWDIVTSEITDSQFHEIGWFRLSFRVYSTFPKKQYFINYSSLGGSTLYFNGEELAQSGTPSPDPDKEVVSNHFPSIVHNIAPITIEPGQNVVIAVRYSLHDEAFYNTFSYGDFNPVQFTIFLTDLNHIQSIDLESRYSLSVLLIIGVILFMVMFLHLLMHFRFKTEKGNFWIFLIALILFTIPLMFGLDLWGIINNPKIMHVYDFMGPVFIFLPISLIPVSMGRLLDIEFNKYWFYLPFSSIVPVLMHIIFSGSPPSISMLLVFGVLLILVIIGAFRIIRRAKDKKRRYLWLITGSLFSYPALFLVVIILITVFSFDNEVLALSIFSLLLTTLPIGFSVYQILRFFNAHGNLQQEVKERTSELQQSLQDLKATQEQLVQKEKLASLGQLTAGIAHEIKNPLNFVNNFSDLSVELVEESKEELSALRRQLSAKVEREKVDEVLAILDDIEANLRKIHEHGSRADGIVKSMLEHNRGGSGKMEPTNLNALIKEYVNLSFHGMRASEEPINVDIEINLDEDVGEVPLIAEDFSRVIVNLCNNGFDAMREELSEKSKGKGEKYVPKLTVRTKRGDDSVTIEVEDNGPGIPEEMKDKILQPFFTTKKGTEGTGLGLSITNDIVKAHGGKLEVESSKEGSVFRIQLK